jgi:DNA-directed RNA polymerase subunit E'/Rpb7
MDPIFERREIVRNIHLEAKRLQRNIYTSLLAQLRMKYEGVCVPEGYISPQSITIIEHSLGRSNLVKGGLDYAVRFQADICLPHPGQVFKTRVNMRSKIGIHAETSPMKILLPRDLHIGMEDFEDIQDGQEVEFEVVGARFQQGDESIVVLGKLRTLVKPDNTLPSIPSIESQIPMIAAPVGTGDENERKVVTVSVEQTKPSAGIDTRKKRVRLNAPSTTNESSAKRET